MSEVNPEKKKRAAKRYSYPRAAQCEIDGQILEVQVLNISRSGIQFASRTKIESRSPVRIRWKDTQFGLFDPTLLIAREIHNPESSEFQYYYGAQYFSLTPDVKDNLLILLKSFMTQSKQETEKNIEKAGYRTLLDVIDQGSDFLRQAFGGMEVPAHVADAYKLVSENEKIAFDQDDEISKCIQNLALLSFHSNILILVVKHMAQDNAIIGVCVQYIDNVLRKITEAEVDCELLGNKLIDDKDMRGADKKVLQKNLNESNNRLFYTKQDLLQSLMEVFANVESESSEFTELFGKISNELQRIQQFTNTEFREESQVFQRRSKKPNEYSRAEAIVDVASVNRKPKYFLWLGIFFIIIFIAISAVMKMVDMGKKSSFQEELGISIKILEFERIGSQVDIVVKDDDWKKLTKEGRIETYKKIVKYLQKDRNARACMIVSDKGNIIQTLFESMLPP